MTRIGHSSTERKSLGKALRTLREKTVHFSKQANAAKAIGISASYLSKIENGQVSPGVALLRQIANGYRVEVATVFALVGMREFELVADAPTESPKAKREFPKRVTPQESRELERYLQFLRFKRGVFKSEEAHRSKRQDTH